MKALKKLYQTTVLTAFALSSSLFTSCNQDSSAKDEGNENKPITVQIEGQNECTISDPITHENLSVYLIRGKGQGENMKVCTLSEAMKEKTVIVHETGNVNQLTIENKSPDTYVFIHSGDIVKGGKQDRTLANSIVIPPNTKPVAVQSFCVEQSRWAKRGNEELANFSVSSKSLNSKALKFSARSEKSQGKVWASVAQSQMKMSGNVYKGDATKSVNAQESATSLQLSLENEDLEKLSKEYIVAITEKMPQHDDIIGYAFAINGEFNSADVYLSHDLFNKVWNSRLDAMASEAIAEQDDKKKFTTPAVTTIAKEMESNKDEKVKEEKLALGNQNDIKENDKLISYGACFSVHAEKQPVVFHYNSISKKGLELNASANENMRGLIQQRVNFNNDAGNDLQQMIVPQGQNVPNQVEEPNVAPQQENQNEE